MNSDTRVYLDALFANKPPDSKILIWSKRGEGKESLKLSRWADNVDQALKAVVSAESEDGWDIYAGQGTGAKNKGSNARVLAKEVVSIAGLFADIDFGDAGHKSKGTNPPTITEALAIVESLGVPASMIVNSGGGLHAYWLFGSAWRFADEAERARAAELAEGWQRFIKLRAKDKGYSVDSTYDLARVLRVPGTTNWKTPEDRRLCQIIKQPESRYTPEELRALIPEECWTVKVLKGKSATAAGETIEFSAGKPAEEPAAADASGGGELVSWTSNRTGLTYQFRMLNTAQPPLDKFIALQANEPKFEASTKYQRKDFKEQSPSNYDCSLATYAVNAGWNDQEIVDLLIFVRRTHKQDLKLRADYYGRTIEAARMERIKATANERRNNAVDDLKNHVAARRVEATGEPAAESNGNGNGRRVVNVDKQRQYLSDAIGLRIKRIQKFLVDPPQYRIETDNGGIHLGPVKNLISQNSIREAIAATEGTCIPKFDKDSWEAISQALLDACELVDTGSETRDSGAIIVWLEEYLANRKPGKLSVQTIANKTPHIDPDVSGSIGIHLYDFKQWIEQRQGEKLSAKELGVRMRGIGAIPFPQPYDVPIDGDPEGKTRRTTCNVWRIKKRD